VKNAGLRDWQPTTLPSRCLDAARPPAHGAVMTSSASAPKSGLPFALGAYAIWGAMPIYIKLLGALSAFEVLAHRILWSLPVALACVVGLRQWNDYRAAMTKPRLLGVMLLSSALISINWTVYMWAVMHQQVLATSLGYYLNPLVNVLLGRVVLKERLNRPQALAVGVAVGVTVCVSEGVSGALGVPE